MDFLLPDITAMQPVLHYFLHFIFPAFVAYGFYKENGKKVYLILLATMLADLDHLLADPVFEPCRCSIGYHPLHSYMACIVYFLCVFFRPLRIPAIGLCLHMLTDFMDCMFSRITCS